MSKPRYLTKSRFKLGIECPTKLFYTAKKDYLTNKMEDPFLTALAEGGYQVGELAKCYFPNGHDIITLDYEEAEKQTLELLQQENVIIYEPAIRFKNLFIRIDILVKKGTHFELIEVKSKSFDQSEENPFLNKNGTITPKWKPYLYDVAFQKYVLLNAFPDFSVHSYLMLANKNAKCPTDGLNQKFKIVRRSNNRKGIEIASTLTKEDLKKKILVQVPVDEEVELIYNLLDSNEVAERNFVDEVTFLATKYEQDEKIISEIGKKCANCEFKCSEKEESQGFKNGFKECWSQALGWSEEDFKEENVLSIWNFKKKDALIKKGKIKFSDISKDDISPISDKQSGISSSERQWLQVEMVQKNQTNPFFDALGLKQEMEKWKYPLHFIDFETTSVAIPFNKGRRPYEGIAFQFSHHVVHKNGTVEHFGQYLNTKQGIFPNYDFLRNLKTQLENDTGTIFRYASHENTYLNLIYRQILEDSAVIDDRGSLCAFIKSITKSVRSSKEVWEGERCMVDMWELVKKYYYHPETHGSNSIKKVLPAILNESDFLQKKYSKPIYGTEDRIKSFNFKNHIWIQKDDAGKVIDPYRQLPKLKFDYERDDLDRLFLNDSINDGGAAMIAYAMMQFLEMSVQERKEIEKALLKYCELDTLAMVMIYEYWNDLLKK